MARKRALQELVRVMDTAVGRMERGCVDCCGRLWGIVLDFGQRMGLLATPFQRRLDGEVVRISLAGREFSVVIILGCRW